MIENPHYDISVHKGPKGDKGDTGAQGLKGDKGDTGSQGLKGDKGDTGSQGLKGDKGDTGSQGLKGDKGDQGPAGTFTTPTADVSFGNHRITNLGGATDSGDAVNKNYADSRYIRAGEQINMGSNRITHLDNPADNQDALNRGYADGRYLRSGQNINLGSHSISSSHTPNADNDLVNKNYTDGLIQTQTHTMSKGLSPNVFITVLAPSAYNQNRNLAIWFSLLYNGETKRRIIFHPWGIPEDTETRGHVDAVDYIIYKHGTRGVMCKRVGTLPVSVKEIGFIYTPRI